MRVVYLPIAPWPLYDIAVTYIVWCMTYKRGVRGGGEGLALCNRPELRMQAGGIHAARARRVNP